MRNLLNRSPIKNFLIDSLLTPIVGVLTWIWICASLNHRKKMKAEHTRLIPRKHRETLVLLSVAGGVVTLCKNHGRCLIRQHIHKAYSTNVGVGRIFPGGGNWFFSEVAKRIFPGLAKSGEILFYPLDTKKTTFFAEKLTGIKSKFQIWIPATPIRRPCPPKTFWKSSKKNSPSLISNWTIQFKNYYCMLFSNNANFCDEH